MTLRTAHRAWLEADRRRRDTLAAAQRATGTDAQVASLRVHETAYRCKEAFDAFVAAAVTAAASATLYDTLVADAREERRLDVDSVADRIATAVGCEYSVDALGAALEVLAGAMVRAARDQALADDEEAAREREDDIRDHRRGAL